MVKSNEMFKLDLDLILNFFTTIKAPSLLYSMYIDAMKKKIWVKTNESCKKNLVGLIECSCYYNKNSSFYKL